MTLHEKYAPLVKAAKKAKTVNLLVREEEAILYINGEVNSGKTKDYLWSVYDQIDPNFLSGDLILSINVKKSEHQLSLKVVTQSPTLNIRKGPGTDQPILGKAARNSIVTLLSKYSDTWFLIRSEHDIEGYSPAEYLEVI